MRCSRPRRSSIRGRTHAQLAGTQRRVGACDVEGSRQSDRAGKTAEHPLGDVKRRLAAVFARRRPLVAGNQHRVARDTIFTESAVTPTRSTTISMAADVSTTSRSTVHSAARAAHRRCVSCSNNRRRSSSRLAAFDERCEPREHSIVGWQLPWPPDLGGWLSATGLLATRAVGFWLFGRLR